MKIILSAEEVQQVTVSILDRVRFTTFRMGGVSVSVDRQKIYEQIERAIDLAKAGSARIEFVLSEHSDEVIVRHPLSINDAPLSPNETITYILAAIMDRGWPTASKNNINAALGFLFGERLTP